VEGPFKAEARPRQWDREFEYANLFARGSEGPRLSSILFSGGTAEPDTNNKGKTCAGKCQPGWVSNA